MIRHEDKYLGLLQSPFSSVRNITFGLLQQQILLLFQKQMETDGNNTPYNYIDGALGVKHFIIYHFLTTFERKNHSSNKRNNQPST